MLVAVATQMLMTKSMMKLYGGNSEVVTGQLLMTRQRSVEHHCQSCSKGSNWKCEKSKVQGGGNVGLENVGIDHRIEKCGNKSSEHLTSC